MNAPLGKLNLEMPGNEGRESSWWHDASYARYDDGSWWQEPDPGCDYCRRVRGRQDLGVRPRRPRRPGAAIATLVPTPPTSPEFAASSAMDPIWPETALALTDAITDRLAVSLRKAKEKGSPTTPTAVVKGLISSILECDKRACIDIDQRCAAILQVWERALGSGTLSSSSE